MHNVAGGRACRQRFCFWAGQGGWREEGFCAGVTSRQYGLCGAFAGEECPYACKETGYQDGPAYAEWDAGWQAEGGGYTKETTGISCPYNKIVFFYFAGNSMYV